MMKTVHRPMDFAVTEARRSVREPMHITTVLAAFDWCLFCDLSY